MRIPIGLTYIAHAVYAAVILLMELAIGLTMKNGQAGGWGMLIGMFAAIPLIIGRRAADGGSVTLGEVLRWEQ